MIIKLNRAKDGREFTFGPYDVTQSTVEDDRANALIADNLSIDTFSFTLKSRDSDYEPLIDENDEYVYDENDELIYVRTLNYATVDFTQYTKYKDIVRLYSDNNVLLGKYYVEKVTAASGASGEITFTCVSIMGILDNMQTHGGIYPDPSSPQTPVYAGDLIAELMGGYTYSIDGALSTSLVYGWIPAGTRREALKQILFPLGASMLKDRNGDPEFTFNVPQTVEVIDTTFIGGELTENSEAAKHIELTEHTFYVSSSVDPEVIYENTGGTTADYDEIIFDEPYHTLIGTGITIHESGANYAIISGTGTLTGTPFLHIKKVLAADTGANSTNNVKPFNDAYLVSQLNSAGCLNRLVNYYGQTAEVSVDIKGGAQNPGALIQVVSPTDYTKKLSGYIKSIKRSFSKIIKASVKLTYNWTPKDVGNAFDSYLIVTAADLVNGKWNVPTDLVGKPALVVLFGGAQGGYGGYDGEAGGQSIPLEPDHREWYDRGFTGGSGGAGGAGAQGGGGGKYLAVNFASLASSYTASIGAGGAGGAHNGGAGAIGGDTTLGSYSTNVGNLLDGFEYVNLIDQTSYGQVGASGTAGKAGGRAGDFSRTGVPKEAGEDGEDYNPTWTGGAGGDAQTKRSGDYRSYSSGSGGGGGAYGSNGGDVTQVETSTALYTEPGTGANAVAPAKAEFYHGGDGGHGGGGGAAVVMSCTGVLMKVALIITGTGLLAVPVALVHPEVRALMDGCLYITTKNRHYRAATHSLNISSAPGRSTSSPA